MTTKQYSANFKPTRYHCLSVYTYKILRYVAYDSIGGENSNAHAFIVLYLRKQTPGQQKYE